MTKVLQRIKRNCLLAIIILGFFGASAQTTRSVGSQTELTAALNASKSGDIIQITNNFVVKSPGDAFKDAVIIRTSLTINGDGYTISVERPALDEMGKSNLSPSNYRAFSFNQNTSSIVNNLTIKGGYLQDNNTVNGGAIYNAGTLTLNNCVISNSQCKYAGGGIYNGSTGVLYLKNTNIIRNRAASGGGLSNNGGTVYIENSALTENWSTSSDGGGGAIENRYTSETKKGLIYVNNSTISNNQSAYIGGAIYNVGAIIYFINSSDTGNVVHGDLKGGAIGNFGGTVYAVNSLFAYNYIRKPGTGNVAVPSEFILDDMVAKTDQNKVNMYYCIYHATIPTGMGANVSNINYSGSANGSDNSIFSGGILSKITNASNNEIGDATALVYRPFLYNNNGSIAPTLKTGSFVLVNSNGVNNLGTRTRFANNNNQNPVVAYFDGSTYINLTPAMSSQGQEVLIDQIGADRPNPPARGALQGTVDNLFMVKVLNGSGNTINGTINGGTLYGDVYPQNASVFITAIPYNGSKFVKFTNVSPGGGTAITSNPYAFTVTGNITLQPDFATLTSGSYYVTYIGNGNTSGTPPAPAIIPGSPPSYPLSEPGNLSKTGYTFNGWATNAIHSGTTLPAGYSYNLNYNRTFYAQWSLGWTLDRSFK